MSGDLQSETVELLQRLIRFDTVNPPGNERPAIEHLERYCAAAGFACVVLADDPERPNLVATLGDPESGPVLCLLGHVDTVLADPEAWEHDPWSGDVADGCVWGRGALDMKSQVAAEAVAAVSLARDGWRPARGAVRLVFVSDEETGGDVGARWLCENHPDAVRCTMLLNEGAGEVFEFAGRRHYGVCCAEKGIYRFTITAHGEAGHASMPTVGDNALLKLGPVLGALADPPPDYVVTEAPAALLSGLGLDPDDPAGALRTLREQDPMLFVLAAPMFEITLTPTMASASQKMNVIPSRAEIRVDCRTPPGLGEAETRARIERVLGIGDSRDGPLTIEFTERTIGNASPVRSELMSFIESWVEREDPGASAVPLILPGFSDSNWFRTAFPECVAYGFFPQRHQSLLQTAPLVHNANERIDVRDLGVAAGFYRDCLTGLLG
ncbi:MAG TPA: M20/M25/M40 family metallo-hydrolase [Solirubrobacteraceae bacterium]|nr:M20/M25/M40 family metallo-hydrolase [Solirubrobacteraceae bacterium]